MNRPASFRSRPICVAVRRWEACLGAASGLTRLSARHLRGCPACREFFAEDDAFAETLRRDARRWREQSAAASPALERAILRAVREAAGAGPGTGAGAGMGAGAGEGRAGDAREPISPVWARALGLSSVVAAALALVVFWPMADPGDPGAAHGLRPAPAVATVEGTEAVAMTEAVNPNPTPNPTTIPAEASAHLAAPPGWWRDLEERGAELVWTEQNPLEREIASVRDDARAVLGFLALNFLPPSPPVSSPPSSG